MATSASYTNHFVSLAISFLVLLWAIRTYSWPAISRDLFAPDVTHSALAPEILAWEKGGVYVQVAPFPGKVFTKTVKPSNGGSPRDTLLLVHGFPSSSFDYRATAQQLADSGTNGFEVVCFDFPGYGLSSKPNNSSLYSYSLMSQADVALAVWTSLFGADSVQLKQRRFHLVGHDMGVSVSQELMARRVLDKSAGAAAPPPAPGVVSAPDWFRNQLVSLTLNNGGMIVELASLRISQILLRWPIIGPFIASIMNYPVFRAQIRGILASPDTFDELEMKAMYQLFGYGGGHRISTELIGYVSERYVYGNSRWLRAVAQSDVPVHVLWGGRDTVAPLIIATTVKERAPNVQLTVLESAGHFAMIEQPVEWMRALLSFIEPLTVSGGGSGAKKQ